MTQCIGGNIGIRPGLLRSLSAEPNSNEQAVRKCSNTGCEVVLSKYNKDSKCHRHKEPK